MFIEMHGEKDYNIFYAYGYTVKKEICMGNFRQKMQNFMLGRNGADELGAAFKAAAAGSEDT